MPTLSQAPLIEVATQIRWGVAERDSSGDFQQYIFTDEEKDNLLDTLEDAIVAAGFTTVDHFAPEVEDVPFTGARRYRRAPDAWPIIQIGLGVFSVHQANDGYQWVTYKEQVLRTLDLLSKALIGFYGTAPFVGAELMYLDAFSLEDRETPFKFLRKKFALKVAQPREFLSATFIDREPVSAGLSLEYRLLEPAGLLILGLDYAELQEWSGYLMDTRVRSLGAALAYTSEGVDVWLEQAHNVQRHAFRTLIDPTYRKSFQ